MNRKILFTGLLCLFATTMLFPELSFASVESTLDSIKTTLISTILPLVAMVGLVLAALSFAMGNPNARNHLTLAVVGALVGFGAPSIVAFLRGLVH